MFRSRKLSGIHLKTSDSMSNWSLLTVASSTRLSSEKSRRRRSRRRAFLQGMLGFVFAASSSAYLSGSAQAQLYWNTNGTPASWTASNWGTAAGGPFTTGWTNNTNTVFNANSSVNWVTNQQIGNITVASGISVTLAPTGTLSTNGNVRTIDVGANSTLDFANQTISTTSGTGFIKNGSGTWAIGVNSGAYNGGFTLNNGTVIVGGNSSFGSGLLTINGGNIQSSGTRAYTNNITVGGNFTNSGTGNATFSGTVSLGAATRTITNEVTGSNRRAYTGVISGANGSGLTFDGTGSGPTYIGNASNSFTGTISINGSEVGFANNGSFGNAANTIVIDGGRLSAASTSGGAVTYALASTHGIQVGDGAGTSISVVPNGALTYGGVIANKSGEVGSWAKQGSGTLELGGVSTYTGTTDINNGTLRLTTGNDRLPTGTVVSLGQSASASLGTLDLNSLNQTIAGLNSTTGLNATSANNTVTSSGIATLTLGGSGTYSYGDGTAANSGVIAGSISLIKSGTGTQTLGDTNTYTDGTTISGGTLILGHVTDTLADTGTVNVNGGTLSIGANSDTVGDVTLTSGSITGSGGVLSGNSYDVQNGSVSAILGGIGALSKNSGGTVTLTESNTYSGGTIISDGMLVLGNATNTLEDGGTIEVNGSNAMLSIGANNDTVGTVTLIDGSIAGTTGVLTGASYEVQNGDVSAILGGAAGLTKSNAGIVTLSGANTYTGGTTVNNGLLIVSSSGSLANNSDLTIDSFGTADFQNAGQTLGAVFNANTLTDALYFSANTGTVTLDSLTGDGSTTFGSDGTVTGGISGGTVTSVGALNADISGTANIIAGGLLTGNISDGTVSAGSLSSTSVTGGLNNITGVANITTLSGGDTTVGGDASIGTMTSGTAYLNGVTSSITTLNSGTVNLGGGELTVSNGTMSGDIAGYGSLVKDSGGTLTLSNAISYSGETYVNAGELVVGLSGSTTGNINVNGGKLTVNGSATGNLIVSSGATLAGAGTIGTNGGTAYIAGTHNPGNSPGVQTFNSDLTYDGATVNWELIGNANGVPGLNFDSIVVGGNLDFASSTLLNLDFASAGSGVLWSDSFWDTSKTGTNGWLLYDVANSTAGFGNFSLSALTWTDSGNISLTAARSGASFGLVQDGNNVYLNYTISAVPEPSSVILLTSSVVVFAYLKRRRKLNDSRAC